MKGKTTLVFTGDIGFDKYMDGKWDDEDLLSAEVLSFLKTADHVITNVEGPLCTPQKADTKTGAEALLHSMDPKVADFLKRINSDIWNICNNHIMDCGPQGLSETLSLAVDLEAKTIGAGMNLQEASKPVILEEAGGIGMFGVGYQRACRKADENTPGCFSWSDLDLIQKRIAKIKKTCRWCIIVAHAGEEFTSLPSPYTRERYKKYLSMGADIVVAHHPHVPMNYEMVGENKAIFYSLGNFVFDTDYQRSQYNTEKGLLLKIKFTPKEFFFEPMGLLIDRKCQRVRLGILPKIFENIQEEDYQCLAPMSTKVFIEATKRQLKYLWPEKFENATEEDFIKNFMEEKRSGRVPGETLDFQILLPFAETFDQTKWDSCKLKNVKEYILEQK